MSGEVTVLRMDQPLHCRVSVQGSIDERWRDWFDRMQILADAANETCLSGELPDQAALLGLLQRLYSLGYPIIRVEVERID